MTYKELYEKAASMLDSGEITLGDFNKMVKPLDVEIQPEPHWIPTSERSPTVLEDVILCYYDTVTVGWLQSDGSWMINDGYAQVSADEVSAWMPLPEPYKGVTE